VAIAGELPLPVESGGGAVPGPTQVNNLVDLYRHHQQRIYRYCLALLRNPDDAEDATQETFTRAAPFLPNLPGDLSAYLTTVARNICCDVVRARSRRPVPLENVPLADRRVSPERQSVDWDVVRRMWRQLSPAERLLFAYTFAGYKYEEIATRTGMSRPSVSVGLARARRRLRDLAAATGTLALLPVAVRRLLERLARRANNTAASAQAALVGVVDQVGVAAVGLLSGLFAISAAGPALAAPAFAPVASRQPAALEGAGVEQAATATEQAPAQRLEPAKRGGPTPPAASILPPAAAPVGAVIPGATATPDQTSVRTLAASPGFPSDHIVFVTGTVQDGSCVNGQACPALFRSGDAGASWTRLSMLTYQPGLVLLPPHYPADPAFFVVERYRGLEESPTGDGTFTWTVPGVVAAAIAPWSPSRHAQLAAVVGDSVQLYAEGNNAARPGPALPPGFVAYDIAFSAPDTVVVSGVTPNASGGLSSVVAACPLSGACPMAAVLPASGGGAPALAVSANVASDHVVTAMGQDGLYVSRDGGRSFALVARPPADRVFSTATVGTGPLGPRIVVSSDTTRPTVLYSDDLGQTFVDATGNLDAGARVIGMAAFPDGTLLAGLLSEVRDNFGLRVSSGGGRWINPA
jgi:RNA polymerase sigma factor (sigma-70 family)